MQIKVDLFVCSEWELTSFIQVISPWSQKKHSKPLTMSFDDTNVGQTARAFFWIISKCLSAGDQACDFSCQWKRYDADCQRANQCLKVLCEHSIVVGKRHWYSGLFCPFILKCDQVSTSCQAVLVDCCLCFQSQVTPRIKLTNHSALQQCKNKKV